jgi:bifunctional DNase/RNase
MKVHRLVLDPNTNSPIVVLQDESSGSLLPIWIGIFEAHSIAMKLEGVEPARPMTHDLLRSFFDVTKSLVERVEVVDLVDNTYFARIYFSINEQAFALDSRPSDAIALALRTVSPIFVANHVLEKNKIQPHQVRDVSAEEGAAEEEPEAGEKPAKEEEWEEILRKFSPPGGKPPKVN